MTTAVQNHSLTYEEERGKPMPSRNHGRAQVNLIKEFVQQEQFSFYSEMTLTIGGVNYTPDISVYPPEQADFRHDEVTRTDLPLIAVEILSPSQSLQDVVEKAEIYLRAGIKSVWIVSLPLRIITVLLPDGREEVFSRGIVKDPVVSLSADLAKVFS